MKKPQKHVHNVDDEDGCLCDVEVNEAELTGDESLPAASGGVAPLGAAPGDQEQIDGCEEDFTINSTPDEDLPAATGGVG